MLKVKICGITSVADALLASEEGADFIGLIFAKSVRRVEIARAREIADEMPESVTPVGVFSNQPAEEVRGILSKTGIRYAQLHGQESVDYAATLGVRVIKAFDTYTNETLEQLRKYDSYAYLLDLPKDPLARGTVDVDWARCAKKFGRVFLAGRLTADNVSDMIRRIRPFAVDCCSYTEMSPGRKDRSKLHEFVQAARDAEHHTTTFKVRTR